MTKKIDLFPITVYETEYENYNLIQDELIEYIQSNFHQEFINEYHGHDHPIRNGALYKIYDQYGFDKEGESKTIKNPHLKNLYDWISFHGQEYWKSLNFSNKLNPYILQLWATATGRGGFVASHNHNPVPVAGVFYLKAEPKLGNLFLENPNDLVLGKSAYNADRLTPTRFNHEIESVSGKLVLFPGWMKHFTRPNPTDEIRMSMAVNFGCHGQVYFTESA
jgi:uncharacterized protein (TIGR02466 family)